jgi:hypothetical protein
MKTCKNGLHAIRGPHDLRPRTGYCIRCSRSAQSAYTSRCRNALRTLRQIEAIVA